MCKTKAVLSPGFIASVNELVRGAFALGEKKHRVKEHSDLEFALSAVTQILERGEIYDSTLQTLPKHLGKHRRNSLISSQVGTKGLTVYDDGNGTVVHLLQPKGAKDEMQGTYIHEVIHVYAHDDFKTHFGKDLDEGVTELFAREVMLKVDPTLPGRRGKVYYHELNLAEMLVDTFGRGDVADAYFRGDARIIGLAKTGFQAKSLVKGWKKYKSAGGRSEDPPLFQILSS